MIDVSIVLPCYNEEEALPLMLPRIHDITSTLRRNGISNEILVVDDGSSDSSVQLIQKLTEGWNEFKLIEHARQHGYGEALKTGFRLARGEKIIFLDLDNTYWPEDMHELLKAANSDELDMILGERPFFSQGMPWTRALGNSFFSWGARRLFASSVGDVATGFRCISRTRIPECLALPSEGLSYSFEMTLTAIHRGWKIGPVPIRYSERAGLSKLSVFSDGLRFLRLLLFFRWKRFKNQGDQLHA